MSSEQRRAWAIVGVIALMLLLTGSYIPIFGVFFMPLIKEFGWSRARLSATYSITYGTVGVGSALAGWLVDRIGAKSVMIAGEAMIALAFVLAGHAHSQNAFRLAFALLGSGSALCGPVPQSAVIVNWFEDKRGVAMACMTAAGMIGISFWMAMASWLIGRLGWRMTYTAMAVPPILMVLLVPLVIQTHPAGKLKSQLKEARKTLAVLQLGEAFRSRSLYLVICCCVVFLITNSALMVHTVANLTGLGYRTGPAAFTISAIHLIAVAGGFGFGMLADRIGVRRTLSLDFLVIAASVFCLSRAAHTAGAVLYALLYGVGDGGWVLIPLLTAAVFGHKYYGTLFGLVIMVGAVSASAGPTLLGASYDQTGSYQPAFAILIALLLIAATVPLACVTVETAQDKSTAVIPKAASRH